MPFEYELIVFYCKLNPKLVIMDSKEKESILSEDFLIMI